MKVDVLILSYFFTYDTVSVNKFNNV